MKWLAVWLVLTGVLLAAKLALPLLSAARFNFTVEDLAHVAIVPLAQVAALRVVAAVRGQARRPSPPRPSSPAPFRPPSPGEEGEKR
jgi:hypothetical protein